MMLECRNDPKRQGCFCTVDISADVKDSVFHPIRPGMLSNPANFFREVLVHTVDITLGI